MNELSAEELYVFNAHLKALQADLERLISFAKSMGIFPLLYSLDTVGHAFKATEGRWELIQPTEKPRPIDHPDIEFLIEHRLEQLQKHTLGLLTPAQHLIGNADTEHLFNAFETLTTLKEQFSDATVHR